MNKVNWDELRKPLDDDEIEWRVQRCGKDGKGKVWALLVPYNDARAVMKRFDEAFGWDGWKDEYRPIQIGNEHGFICRVYYRDDNGDWLYHEDGSQLSDIEPIKGGISGALKRVAVKFGMGRELYDMKDIWATNIQDGYPPRGDDRAIKISSAKDKSIKAWCYPPSVNKPTTVDEASYATDIDVIALSNLRKKKVLDDDTQDKYDRFINKDEKLLKKDVEAWMRFLAKQPDKES